MKVLFIGHKKSHNKYLSNSYLQYSALKKLYKNVDSIDTSQILFLCIRIAPTLGPKLITS